MTFSPKINNRSKNLAKNRSFDQGNKSTVYDRLFQDVFRLHMKGIKQENTIVTYRSGERIITLGRNISIKAKQNLRDFIN